MRFSKAISLFLSTLMTSTAMSNIDIDKAFAASPIQLPGQFAIENANNTNFVVDKYGDNHTLADRAHLYPKENPNTYVFYGNRAANGSYEVHLKSAPNLCLTMDGGLNPNQGNGTIAVFSNNCANSLNLMFMNDQTIRVSRNQNLCLTNQGNRHSTKLNKIHFWACDNSPETKWNVNGNVSGVVVTPPVVTQTVTPAASTINTQTLPKLQFVTKPNKKQFAKPTIKLACGPCVFVISGVALGVLAAIGNEVYSWGKYEGNYQRVLIKAYSPDKAGLSWTQMDKICKINYPGYKTTWQEIEGEGSVKACVKPYSILSNPGAVIEDVQYNSPAYNQPVY
jgi:hypothetical protein